MKTLYQAIQSNESPCAVGLLKHLRDFGIESWSDCTRTNLQDFVDHISGKVAQSSTHTYIAVLKAVLNRYKEDIEIPCRDIAAALSCKNEGSQKVYLSDNELERLERVGAMNETERFCQLCFLISTRTGMRISDTLRANDLNISDGVLSYVSQKTSILARVPVNEKVSGWITEANECKCRPSLPTIENTLRKLCMRANINERVRIFKAGKEKDVEKWQAVSSHTGRITFCTLLSQKGVSVTDIMQMAGHTNPIQTARYIVRSTPKLNEKALAFLNA